MSIALAHYVPVALKTVKCPVVERDGARGRRDSDTMLCIWEVGKRIMGHGATWVFIAWDIGLPGVRFTDCADREQAMSLFERESVAVQMP